MPQNADLEINYANSRKETLDLHLGNLAGEITLSDPNCPEILVRVDAKLPFGDGSTEVTITREIFH